MPPRHATARTEILQAGSQAGKIGPSHPTAGATGTHADDPGDRRVRQDSLGDAHGFGGGSERNPACDTRCCNTRGRDRKTDRWKTGCRNNGKPASDAVSPRPLMPGARRPDRWTTAETRAILIRVEHVSTCQTTRARSAQLRALTLWASTGRNNTLPQLLCSGKHPAGRSDFYGSMRALTKELPSPPTTCATPVV